MTISNECMVLNLQVGLWAGHRLDKDASQRVTTEAGADADAVGMDERRASDWAEVHPPAGKRSEIAHILNVTCVKMSLEKNIPVPELDAQPKKRTTL